MDFPQRFLDKTGFSNIQPAFIFNYAMFSRILMGDLSELREDIKTVAIMLRRTTHYLYNNTSSRMSNIYGEEFAFSIHANTVTLWTHNGQILIAEVALASDLKERENQIKYLLAKTEDFTNGFVLCANCDKKIKYHENMKHRYCAGLYCGTCWENSIKEKAEKENYN